MNPSPARALLLVGFQNDYFAEDGALRAAVEETTRESQVLEHTIALIERLVDTDTLIVNLPLVYSPDYGELPNPTGLLATIRDIGAFRHGSPGSEVVPEIRAFGDRIVELSGKTGFNAFLGTRLNELLAERGVRDVAVAGVVTSVCIDSTARAASEFGYATTILSDCIAGKSALEHEFYCDNVFPIYAHVQPAEAWAAAAAVRDAA